MVIRLGFEPKTHSLEGCCSIQLSYQTIFSAAKLRLFFNLRVFPSEKFHIILGIPVSEGCKDDADACFLLALLVFEPPPLAGVTS